MTKPTLPQMPEVIYYDSETPWYDMPAPIRTSYTRTDLCDELKASLTKANEELVAYRNFTLDIKEFTKVCICQCGEKMADTDLKIYLNMLKAKLAIIAAQEKMK